MVLQYNKKDFDEVFLFVKENTHRDFYVTENNRRILIKDANTLKILLKDSKYILINKDGNNVNGLLTVWYSLGGNIKRKYIKIRANNYIADKLLTVLFWNSSDDFYIKINKYSELIDVLRQKGFDFFHDRGDELLLVRRNRSGIYNNRS